MSAARSVLVGAWRFVVGDDWQTALGAALAIGLTAVLAGAGLAAWWVMPLAVAALLALSVARATRQQRRVR